MLPPSGLGLLCCHEQLVLNSYPEGVEVRSACWWLAEPDLGGGQCGGFQLLLVPDVVRCEADPETPMSSTNRNSARILEIDIDVLQFWDA